MLVEVINFEVRYLKINGASECFYYPADFIRVQQRCMKTSFSFYFDRGMSLIAARTAYADVELKSEKLLFAIKAKNERLLNAY